MIKDLEAVKKQIVTWLEEQVEKSGTKSLIVGVSGGIDSALVTALCSHTKYDVVGVLMPCHSKKESIERGMEVVSKFNVKHHVINLEKSFDGIVEQNDHELSPDDKKYVEGSLRSRLRAPVLGYFAKINKGLIVGTGNRSEDSLLRYFDKFGDGSVDISPISGLFKSEVYQLAEYLGVPESVLKAKPTADLWGEDEQTDEGELGMSYDEVEWAERYIEKYDLDVNGENMIKLADEHHHLNPREKFVLKEVAKHEINTRHKYNPNLPECRIKKEYLD